MIDFDDDHTSVRCFQSDKRLKVPYYNLLSKKAVLQQKKIWNTSGILIMYLFTFHPRNNRSTITCYWKLTINMQRSLQDITASLIKNEV